MNREQINYKGGYVIRVRDLCPDQALEAAADCFGVRA
jgi:hypothetical protein